MRELGFRVRGRVWELIGAGSNLVGWGLRLWVRGRVRELGLGRGLRLWVRVRLRELGLG